MSQHLAPQRGQAGVEYLIGLTTLFLILIALPDNIYAEALENLKTYWTNYSFLLSQP